jgi:hypothetical protein
MYHGADQFLRITVQTPNLDHIYFNILHKSYRVWVDTQ